MFAGIIAVAIQLDTLSVPGPRAVVTDYQIGSSPSVPTYGTYAPAATNAPQAAQPPVASTSTPPTVYSSTANVPSGALSPEALLTELEAGGPQRTLVDAARSILPPQTVSPVGAFDRVVVSSTQSSQTPSPHTNLSSTAAGYSALSSACVDGAAFTHMLRLGSQGDEVRLVQHFLNVAAETRLAEDGVGSPGKETDTFAQKTLDAVKKFQTMYAADILTPLGLRAPTGEWGTYTRQKANQLVCGI